MPDAFMRPDASEVLIAESDVVLEEPFHLEVPGVVTLDMPAFTITGLERHVRLYEVFDIPPPPSTSTIHSRVFRIDPGDGGTSITVDVRIFDVDPVTRPRVNEMYQFLDGEWRHLNQGTYYNAATRTQVGRTYYLRGMLAVVARELPSTSGPAVDRGRRAFFRETFGNEAWYGGTLDLDGRINALGLTPRQLLDEYGLKLDVDVLQANGISDVRPFLDDAASARRMLAMGAFLGISATVDNAMMLSSFGIACGLCHGQVDDSVREGVGRLRPGMPNEELDFGRLLALSTTFSDGERAMLQGWGRGLVDTRWSNAFEDNVVNPTAIPPIWDRLALAATPFKLGWDGLFTNLTDQALAFYDVVMHVDGEYAGTGLHPMAIVPAGMSFEDGDATDAIDRAVLDDIVAWEQSLISPQPVPFVDFDPVAAERGWYRFIDASAGGGCVNCHQPPELASDIRVNFVPYPPAADAFSSHDVPDLFFGQVPTRHGMRAPPLRGIRATAPYMSDHAASTLEIVVEGDAQFFGFSFRGTDRADLIEYLKSL